MTKAVFTFSGFKPYARFILENEAILQDLSLQYFQIARESAVPLLKQLAHLSEQELEAVARKSVSNFLEQALEDNAMEGALTSLKQWKAGTFLNIPRENIEINDLIKLYSIRKKICISALHLFTRDVTCFQQIVNELDAFYAVLQEYAFTIYVEIQHEALLEEKEFISSIINNNVDGILAFDKELRITALNSKMEDWHGVKKANVLGQNIFTAFPAYKDAETDFNLPAVLSGQSRQLSERPFENRNGYYEANIIPLLNRKGETTGGYLLVHETTQRKKTELLISQQNRELAAALKENDAAWEQLKEANEVLEERVKKRTEALSQSEATVKKREEQLRLIIDAIPGYVSYISKNRTYQEINKAYEKLFAKSREKIIGQAVWEVIGQKAYDNIQGYMDKAMAGENISYETLQDYQVEKIYTKATFIPHTVNNETIGIFTLVQDITKEKDFQQKQGKLFLELKKANIEKEAALAEVERQRQQLHNLFLQAPAHLAIMRGPDFIFELANPHYLEILGIKESIEGKPLLEVMLDLEPVLKDILTQVYTTGIRFIGKELPVKRDWENNGMPYTRNFTVIYEPIKGATGETEGIISFGYEVSDQVAAREQLASLNKKLEKLNLELKAKNNDLLRTNTDLDNFVYTASHDLKSPVANLEGLMKLLNTSLTSQANEKQTKLLAMADTSVQKLKQIIKDLVEITKVQKDLEESVEEKVVLKEVVEDVKAGIADLIAESGVTIKENFKLSEIIYKRSNLRSILYNLLSNAIKYRSPHLQAEVEISAWKEDNKIVLSVKDNGLGMTPQQQKKLFTMFKRMHTHIEGTGIGLYTIKRIIENNGGHVEVKSEKGEGSEFKVYFNSKKNRLTSRKV